MAEDSGKRERNKCKYQYPPGKCSSIKSKSVDEESGYSLKQKPDAGKFRIGKGISDPIGVIVLKRISKVMFFSSVQGSSNPVQA